MNRAGGGWKIRSPLPSVSDEFSNKTEGGGARRGREDRKYNFPEFSFNIHYHPKKLLLLSPFHR